ncbi:cystathionine beta-lyase [Inquilinus sp. CAU 1745]|uniref:cystathionine beta-lyase n=1 Tax=Inquilinus sp. CAU 1745 TaxID=3140369 RepID=UPI00325C1A50
MREETRLIHGDARPHADFPTLTAPVHRASTIVFPTVQSFLDRHQQFYDGYSYALYGHPASRELEARIADLEEGVRAVAVPSGLSAITLVNLAFLESGDHVLVPDTVYSPARNVCGGLLSGLGIETTYYDPNETGCVADLIRPETRLIWVESPGSMTMEIQDLPAIAAAARARGVTVAVDNTWASPLFHKPLTLGADLSVQAVSKHIGGHADLILGVVTAADETIFRKLKDTSRNLGLGVSPDDCWLALRGLGTLSARLARQSESALQIATWLSEHPAVERVLYPALASDPGYALWRRDFTGASGVFSVLLRPASADAVAAAIEGLRFFRIGASWGGLHSLVAPSDPRGIRTVQPWTADGQLVRLSIGLEHPDDLIADLERGLATITEANIAEVS